MPQVQTVLGVINAKDFGFALVHEHVMCDFIGAEQTGKARWDADEVVRTMLPFLRQAKERGVTGFVDCTPAYIGRDVTVLKRLSELTGVHIVTNTGYYGAANDKYLPKHAFMETADQLADRWVREWEKGIEDTGVKPGFIKIGVDPATGNPPRLSEVDAKIVRAAARACTRTGLTVACHTGQGAAALEEIRIFQEEGAAPSRLIIVHADAEQDQTYHAQIAERKAWVEFDGIGGRPLEYHLKIVPPMIEKFSDRLLLSMDSGWYWVGEANGGKIRDYNFLTDQFLPALRKAGVTEAVIRKLTVDNAARAFALSC
jgi:phosphotriesterase-related protein